MKYRPFSLLLIVSMLMLSWLAMMIVHEFGHILHAWSSGGRVVKVVLHPLAISWTHVEPNTQFVVWGGPIWGCVLPFAAWVIAARFQSSIEYLLRFFTGFCLIANGIYLGVGFWDPVGDAVELLNHGTPGWVLLLFGAMTVPAGLRLWHRLGPRFGLGGSSDDVDPRHAIGVLLVLVVVVLLEITLSA